MLDSGEVGRYSDYTVLCMHACDDLDSSFPVQRLSCRSLEAHQVVCAVNGSDLIVFFQICHVNGPAKVS